MHPFWIKEKKKRRLPRVSKTNSNTTSTGSLLRVRDEITVQDFSCQTDVVPVQESLSREDMHQIVRDEIQAYSKAYGLPNSYEERDFSDCDSESDDDFF